MKNIATLSFLLLSICSWSQIIGHVDTLLTTSKAENLIKLNNNSFLISGMYTNTTFLLDQDKTYVTSLEIINDNFESIVSIKPDIFNHVVPIHQRSNGRIVCTARDTIQNTYRFITYDENLGSMILNKKLSFDSLLVVEKVISAGIKGNQIEIVARCNYNNEDQNLVMYFDIATLDLKRTKLFPDNHFRAYSLFSGSIFAGLNTIIRYDDSLNVLWTKELLDDYYFTDVVVNRFGEIYVGGYQGPNAVVVKLDATGNWLAQKQIARLDPNANPNVRITDLYLTSDERIVAVGYDASYNPMTTPLVFKRGHPIVGFYERDMTVITSGHIEDRVFINDIVFSNEKIYAILEDSGIEWCCTSKFLEIETMPTTMTQSVAQNFQHQVYPNPATNQLHIPHGEAYTTEIVNMQGKVMLNQKGANNIDVSALESGLYIITTSNNKSRYSQRFVKL